jgi:hypothetical protein
MKPKQVVLYSSLESALEELLFWFHRGEATRLLGHPEPRSLKRHRSGRLSDLSCSNAKRWLLFSWPPCPTEDRCQPPEQRWCGSLARSERHTRVCYRQRRTPFAIGRTADPAVERSAWDTCCADDRVYNCDRSFR